jgi:hypothetical protein
MSRNNRVALIAVLVAAFVTPSLAQQPARPSTTPATAANDETKGELTVELLSNLQKKNAIADLEAKLRQTRGEKRPGAGAEHEARCSVSNYQLMSVYGLQSNLHADIVLCGTAVLTVNRGSEVGDGWKVASIQTSNVTVMRGRQVHQIWMPLPKEQVPQAAATGRAMPGPMALPPLPPNIAPAPYRQAGTPIVESQNRGQ